MKKDGKGFFKEFKMLPEESHFYTPLYNSSEHSFQTERYGEAHTVGCRNSQEDASLFVRSSALIKLKPEQIAERMWSAIKYINLKVIEAGAGLGQGTTACIACIHQNHLITANLADTVLFAALYSEEGKFIAVTRLTENLHHPEEEKERIELNGGRILYGRVNGSLAVGRAIGDHHHNSISEIISSDPALAIFPINQLIGSLNPDNLAVGQLKFIMTCDGFTEAADILHKEHHTYMKNCLSYIENNRQEEDFAFALLNEALERSNDNISVSVLTYDSHCANFEYFAIFDGHGGQNTVDMVVTHFADSFNAQIALSEDDYQKQPLSTTNNQANFLRDNSAMFKVVYEDGVAANEPKSGSDLGF
ncbi:MAG: protein serine/threonine phosphatase 2C family protein [Tatlockia sp.]|nr:protein serine/threonine phosphatase 2C family protein [Tatlockia sp.]